MRCDGGDVFAIPEQTAAALQSNVGSCLGRVGEAKEEKGRRRRVGGLRTALDVRCSRANAVWTGQVCAVRECRCGRFETRHWEKGIEM